MVNFGGKIMPLMSYRCIAAGGPPPAFSKLGAKTRRALEAKFYAGVNGESIRAKIPLEIIVASDRAKLTLTALVGKRPKASGARIARFWRNSEAPTATNFVGLTPSSRHSRF